MPVTRATLETSTMLPDASKSTTMASRVLPWMKVVIGGPKLKVAFGYAAGLAEVVNAKTSPSVGVFRTLVRESESRSRPKVLPSER